MKRHNFTLNRRAAGVLLHVTSLPGPHGVGDIGPAARDFLDFLAAAGQRWWQMLPIGPTGPGDSPYSALSAFAGNPLLISLDQLVADGLLRPRDVPPRRELPPNRAAFGAAAEHKYTRLHRAYRAWIHAHGAEQSDFRAFAAREAGWLDDYALFSVLRARSRGRPSNTWPPALRKRRADALRRFLETHRAAFEFERFLQYVFDRQWSALREYAHRRRVGLIGDIPLFVAHDSSDVWAHPELFDLDAAGRPRTVSGVPPDLFSRTGQKWGHPQYRWSRHEASGFAWWIARFRRMLAMFDATRIDHFLGFHRVWAVPHRARTARRGRWEKTPGHALFATLRRSLGRLEIIAEDLGLLVPEAAALRDRFGFLGMRLLHFAFGPDGEYHRPHRHPPRSVAYPGTHDNDTTAGWLEKLRSQAATAEAEGHAGAEAAADARSAGASPVIAAKAEDVSGGHGDEPPWGGRSAQTLTDYERLRRYAGAGREVLVWDVIRLVLGSPANLAIVAAQDLLGLDSTARMNTPATTRGNWEWRLAPGQLTPHLAARLRALTEAFDRLGE